MARHTFLNTASDIQWLRDNHIPDLPDTVQSAVLYGNEDSPERVDTYCEIDPSIDDAMTMYVIVDGKLVAEGNTCGVVITTSRRDRWEPSLVLDGTYNGPSWRE